MKKYISYICMLSVIIFTCQTAFAVKKDTVAPSITYTDPGNNLSNVEINKAITVKFSEKLLKGSTFSRIKLADSQKVTVSIAANISNNSLIIRPKVRLDYDTGYVLTIPANAVKDSSGNGIKKVFVLKFRTQPDSNAFSVRVYQNGKEIKTGTHDNALHLDRSNFSIRFNMPIEGIVQLAALDASDYYELAQEGMKLEDIPYFIPGTGMAADGPYDAMYINDEGNHYMFYSDDDDSRLALISEDENSIINAEWEVNALQQLDPETYELTEYSFDEYPMDDIYIVAVCDLNDDNIIDEGEYVKLALTFNRS